MEEGRKEIGMRSCLSRLRILLDDGGQTQVCV